MTYLESSEFITLSDYRTQVRTGLWTGPSRGVDPSFVQCNVVILPEDWAESFQAWCKENVDVAPIIASSAPGDPSLPALGEIDIRSDLPQYRIYHHGAFSHETTSLTQVWRDDLVSFTFGCSFSLEEALRRHNIPLRYEERGVGGAIYNTTIDTTPVGPMQGPLVVSMRPIHRDYIEQTIETCRRYPRLHGAPVHVGDPSAIGIDINQPREQFGPITVEDDELPVFWACGVTTQGIIESVDPDLAITHKSGHMLVSDLPLDSDLLNIP